MASSTGSNGYIRRRRLREFNGGVRLGRLATSVAFVAAAEVCLIPGSSSGLTSGSNSATISAVVETSPGGTQVASGSALGLGASVLDAVTLTPSSSALPSGTVTYSFFADATCSGTASSTEAVAVNAGAVPNSNPTSSLSPGGYGFEASYSGDAIYSAATSPCEFFTVSPGTLTATNSVTNASVGMTIAGNATVPRGTRVFDTATVAASSSIFAPTGTVTYGFFYNSACSGTAISPQQFTLGGASTLPSSGSTAPLAPGSYGFEANYSGDTNYAASTSPCQSFNVSKKATGKKKGGGVTPSPANEFYVAPPPFGNDSSGANTCTLKSSPCATLAQAIHEEATLTPDTTGTVISVAAGTYNGPTDAMFAALSASNDDVTISGAGKTTIIEPQTCNALDTTTAFEDEGLSAIVNYQNVTGVTVQNLWLNGGAVAGGACPGYEAAVLAPRSPGGTQNAIVGTYISGGTTFGILQNDNAGFSIISNTLTPVLCSAKIKGPNTGLNAGWGSPADLTVSSIPACAQFEESGHGSFTGVFINGVAYCAVASANSKTVVITGTPPCTPAPTPVVGGVEVPAGATLVFNTSVAPFIKYGIACNNPTQPADPTTICSMSDNTIVAGGWVYNQPIGIVVSGGGVANIDGNKVSDLTDGHGGGTGIALIPDAFDGTSAGDSTVGYNETASSGSGNTLSSNDTGILVEGSTYTTNYTYAVNENTVSSANDVGVSITDMNPSEANGSLSSFSSNSIGGVLTGDGLVLSGVQGQTIGGSTTALGNTMSGNAYGMVLVPCTTGGCGAGLPTIENTIENNSITGNEAFGVLALGAYQPQEIAPSVGPCPTSGLGSCENTFNANTWTGNGASTSVQIAGANILDGTGWGGGCSQPPVCTGGTALLLTSIGSSDAATQQFSPSFPGTATVQLNVCNPGSSSEPIPVGTEITFGTAADIGTFFVTTTAIVSGSGSACTSGYPTSTPLIVQAASPGKVGSPSANGPQPYIVSTGDSVIVDANGTAVTTSNIYGTGPQANSCTPDGVDSVPNWFGTPNAPGTPSSESLDAGTGKVNATYLAC